MIRAIGYLISEALWSLLFRIAPQRFEQDNDPDSTAADTAARTRYIREHRPGGGGRG